MIERGLWIVVTGLDGTGKTTLKRNLVGYFKERNFRVKDFKFPYDKHLLDLMNNVVGEGLPLKDNYSDQMLFTLDNRIVGTVHVKNWRMSHDVLVSQRGYIDTFVHGECRSFSYQEVDELQRTWELERCSVMIHLNADPEVAFKRIKDDPNADKFETLEYIRHQAEATRKAYEEVISENINALSSFKGFPNIYIDTTELTTKETFKKAIEELRKLSII